MKISVYLLLATFIGLVGCAPSPEKLSAEWMEGVWVELRSDTFPPAIYTLDKKEGEKDVILAYPNNVEGQPAPGEPQVLKLFHSGDDTFIQSFQTEQTPEFYLYKMEAVKGTEIKLIQLKVFRPGSGTSLEEVKKYLDENKEKEDLYDLESVLRFKRQVH